MTYTPAVDASTTIRDRIRRDAKFRRAVLCEALDCLITGESAIARSLLRDYINATAGFELLATLTGIPSKSLIRMFGPKGNPTARNFSTVLLHLQSIESVHLRVTPGAERARRKDVAALRKTHAALAREMKKLQHLSHSGA